MSMTLATTWVRRGVAAEFPQKYELDEAELKRIEQLTKLHLADAEEGLNAAQNEASDSDSESEAGAPTQPKSTDDLDEYNMSDYDKEEVDTETGEKFAMLGNLGSLTYHQPGEEDPYLVLPETADSDDEDDRQDLQILPTDNLVLAARVEDEVPHLEVYVYEDDADNIYVHHDVMLPAIPLCLEWLDTSSTKTQGNFVAVGMMQPEIEIWDLDIVDSMYPTAILGQQPEQKEEQTKDKTKEKKKKKKPKPNEEYHVDAVLSLSLNKHHRNLLASGSADTTIKLWDLKTGTCAKSYSKHAGKVTSLDWHPSAEKSTLLLSGSADDKTVVITDMQAPDAASSQWQVEADVERVRWDPHNTDFFYVTTETGTLYYFDSKTPPATTDAPKQTLSKAVWTLAAHDGALSAFDVNPMIPGFLVTGSDDKRVKLWNVQDNKPSMVVSRNLEVGRVFSAQFAPDEDVAFRLCVAGSKGSVQVWDTSTNAAVRKVFAGRVKLPEGDVKERILGLGADDDDESEDEEDDGANGADATGDGWESMDED